MARDTIETILARRSVREYRPEPLPAADLQTILEAGRQAPSAKNLQPWHFVVVTDPQLKAAVAAACCEQHWLAQAAVLVAAVGLPEVSAKWYPVDVAIAVENMVLAACSLGYGSCWIGAFREDAVKALLGVPETARVVCLFPLGVPAVEPPARDRRPLAAVCSTNAWAQPLESDSRP